MSDWLKLSLKNSTETGPQSIAVSLLKIADMSQLWLTELDLSTYVLSVNGLAYRVNAVVGQGWTKLISNVVDADFVPIVPVIYIVYEPGIKLSMSIELNW